VLSEWRQIGWRKIAADPRREEGKETGAKPAEARDPEAKYKTEKFRGSTIQQ